MISLTYLNITSFQVNASSECSDWLICDNCSRTFWEQLHHVSIDLKTFFSGILNWEIPDNQQFHLHLNLLFLIALRFLHVLDSPQTPWIEFEKQVWLIIWSRIVAFHGLVCWTLTFMTISISSIQIVPSPSLSNKEKASSNWAIISLLNVEGWTRKFNF